MKRIISTLMLPLWILLLAVVGNGCTKENDAEPVGSYGYVQFYITKAKLKSNIVLDSLSDAKQVEVLLSYKNQDIRQTVNVSGDEAYLTSEKLRLLAGEYTVKQYTVYDGSGHVLQVGEPTTSSLKIEKNVISNFAMSVSAVLRGTVNFVVSKDYSLLKASGTIVNKPIELYSTAKRLNVTLSSPSGDIKTFNNLKLKAKGTLGLLSTDTTLSLVAGRYKCESYTLLDDKGVTLGFEVPSSMYLDIADFTAKVDTLPIKLARTAAIEDYYALKAIWDKMDGPHWGWQLNEGYNVGTNWNFNKPVDEWGNQPGVFVYPNGRIRAVNLGAFNPKGAIPEELGQLSELEALWCGASSDRLAPSLITEYKLPADGDRIKNYSAWLDNYYHTDAKYSVNYALSKQMQNKPYKAVTYRDEFAPMNGITSLPKSIGNLKKLTALFVGNNSVSELPAEITQCTDLTDLVLYNLPLKEFPKQVGQISSLVALGVSFCDLTNANADEGLKALCNGPAAQRLELLFLDNNYLETIPAEFSNLVRIGLFELGFNRLKTLPAMGQKVKPVIFLASNNQITTLPDDLCNIIDFETFDVSYNKLKTIPRMFSATSPTAASALVFTNNLIEEIPDDYPGFRTEQLFLSENKLKTFSAGLIKSEVNNLVISHNEIDSLPLEIGNMRTLVALDLEGNRLTKLPYTFNGFNLPILKGLSLNFNSLSEISYYLWDMPRLNTLLIQSQYDKNGKRCLTQLAGEFSKNYGLRVLVASGNDFKVFPAIPYYLNYLDISNNPTIMLEIPDYICPRIADGTFALIADKDQTITGCGL